MLSGVVYMLSLGAVFGILPASALALVDNKASFSVAGAILGMDVRMVAPATWFNPDDVIKAARIIGDTTGARITHVSDAPGSSAAAIPRTGRETWPGKTAGRSPRTGRQWRRVVASPMPRRVVEIDTAGVLLDHGVTVVLAGGGGVPVVEGPGGLTGV